MGMRRAGAFLAVMALCFTWAAPAGGETLVFGNAVVHDPSVVRGEDGAYYIFGSHMAAARSEDLIGWTMISRNATNGGCTLFDKVQTELSAALKYARTDTFWAPDVCRLRDGRYYYYYCACQGSSPLSALGVAVSDDITGPYKDLGIFLKSGSGVGYNATVHPNVIDPCVFYDHQGALWMVYGSYSGGIYILEMDDTTGFPKPDQGYGKKLLGKNHARIEGPYILYSPETEYYYLFLSFGGLDANGGYNIRVCRSRTPDGPYEDALGQDMIACGGATGTFFHDPDYAGFGVKLMGGYQFTPLPGEANQLSIAYRSPGHNSAIYDPETGRSFILFHTRFSNAGETFSVRVHEMFYTKDGWPVVCPSRYAGAPKGALTMADVPGDYKLVRHGRDINRVEHKSIRVTLNEDGTLEGEGVTGAWTADEACEHIEFTLNGEAFTGRLALAYDSPQQAWLPQITALSEAGEAVWAIHASALREE